MNLDDSRRWHPEIEGFSDDILVWYDRIAPSLPNPALVVEVGVFCGRSFLFLAERLRQLGHGRETRLVGIDAESDKQQLHGHAKLKEHVATMRALYEPVSVELVLRDSLEAALALLPESVDLVFHDADHEEGPLRAELAAYLPKVKPGGLIAGHDYNPVWKTQWPGVKRAVDALIGETDHYESVWWKRL